MYAEGLEFICSRWTEENRPCQTALMLVLRGAIRYTMKQTKLFKPVAGLIFHKVHNVAVLALPLTSHGAREVLRDMQHHAQTYLSRNPVRAEGREWQIQVDFQLRHAADLSTLSAREGGSRHFPIVKTPRPSAPGNYPAKNDLWTSTLSSALCSHDKCAELLDRLCARDGGAKRSRTCAASPPSAFDRFVDSSSKHNCAPDQWTQQTAVPPPCLTASPWRSQCGNGKMGERRRKACSRHAVTPRCRSNHVNAFCMAAKALQRSASPQMVVDSIQTFVSQQTALGVPGTCLARALQAVKQVPTMFWLGTDAPQLFLKGALLDLAILSTVYGIGITVMDEKGQYPLQILQQPDCDWMLLSVDADYAFDAVSTMHSCGTVSREFDSDSEDDPEWDGKTLGKMADLLSKQATVGGSTQDPAGSPPTEQRSAATISSTEPLGSSPSPVSLEDTWQSRLPLQATETRAMRHKRKRAAFELREGAGKQGSASKLATTSHTDATVISDDELPLTHLAQRALDEDDAQEVQAAPLSPASQPRVAFVGKFENGRVPHRQILWPQMDWRYAQAELNRSVKIKMSLWCMCLEGKPLDPAAIVPRGTTPFDTVEGSLRRLKQPLDYNMLREAGSLIAPTRPTHIGRTHIPIELTNLSPRIRLVDELYDSSEASIDGHSLKVMTTSKQSRDSQEGASSCTLHSQDTEQDEDSSATSTTTFSLNAGGARTRRVQQEAITKTAIERLIKDLGSTSYGLLIEHKCAARVLRTDHRAATAVFQAHSPSQRYAAFAAALHRAGLTDLAKGMTAAADIVASKPGTETEQLTEPPVPEHMVGPDARSDPYQIPAARKRGRPKREMENGSAHTEVEQEQTGSVQGEVQKPDLQDLITKLSQLERWAHGVDRTLSECKPSTSSHTLTPADGTDTPGADSDIPPTVDYTPSDANGQVARRVAQLETAIQQQHSSTPTYDMMTRISRAEAAIKLVASRLGNVLDSTSASQANSDLGNRVDQLEAGAALAAVQLSRLHIQHIGATVSPADGPEQEADLHLDWRIHLIERTIHDHVDDLQDVHRRWSEEWKIAQA
eukprot:2238389-Amphidinium_carterae.1